MEAGTHVNEVFLWHWSVEAGTHINEIFLCHKMWQLNIKETRLTGDRRGDLEIKTIFKRSLWKYRVKHVQPNSS